MKFSSALFILIITFTAASAQTDSAAVKTDTGRVEHVRLQLPDSLQIQKRYLYKSPYSEGTLTLYENDVYAYTFNGHTWWKIETGKWKVNKHSVLILIVGKVQSKGKKIKCSLRRHRVQFSEEVVTARLIKLLRDKTVPAPAVP